MHLSNRQIEGSIVLVVITSIIYLAVLFLYQHPFRAVSIRYSDISSGSVIVELTGDTNRNGIYFISENTMVPDSLKIAEVEGINGSEEKNTKLSTGRTVNINKDDQISIGEMSAAKKLFFNIPIDVNQTSIYDLMLIPGIGEKTAWQIIHFREMNGKLQKIESLMKIPGIKEKRLAGIRKYLYVEDNWTTD